LHPPRGEADYTSKASTGADDPRHGAGASCRKNAPMSAIAARFSPGKSSTVRKKLPGGSRLKQDFVTSIERPAGSRQLV
jgi:hypothetical protein